MQGLSGFTSDPAKTVKTSNPSLYLFRRPARRDVADEVNMNKHKIIFHFNDIGVDEPLDDEFSKWDFKRVSSCLRKWCLCSYRYLVLIFVRISTRNVDVLLPRAAGEKILKVMPFLGKCNFISDLSQREWRRNRS